MKTYVEKRINKNHKSINDYFKMYLQDLFVIFSKQGFAREKSGILLFDIDIDCATRYIFHSYSERNLRFFVPLIYVCL